mmetsp:Transcript_4788/g.17100  ORF Transcript_4788/g.17100 Transcript_4788/m.17100 type:complete len:231 (+) Transcript_4788:693-1385(+)
MAASAWTRRLTASFAGDFLTAPQETNSEMRPPSHRSGSATRASAPCAIAAASGDTKPSRSADVSATARVTGDGAENLGSAGAAHRTASTTGSCRESSPMRASRCFSRAMASAASARAWSVRSRAARALALPTAAATTARSRSAETAQSVESRASSTAVARTAAVAAAPPPPARAMASDRSASGCDARGSNSYLASALSAAATWRTSSSRRAVATAIALARRASSTSHSSR